MKTASIITVHVGANFGSNLQTIATSEVLKRLGLEPIVIDYFPPRVTWKRFLSKWYTPYKFIYICIRLIKRYMNIKIYMSYLKKYCTLSNRIYEEDNFSQTCPKTDYYITGSDQVWNSKYNEGIDKHYFFEGIEGTKIAYASSIGAISLTEEEQKTFPELLKDYKAISVRENSAVELLRNINISAIHVLDPTLMLNKNEWERFASNYTISSPYILVYLPYNISNKELIYKTVQAIAQKKHLKVVTFSWNYFNDRYADKTVKFASPGDFLSLMLNASYIITNSFHGTAFAINLNKQFWVYMPSKFSTRIESLLEICNLNNRQLDSIISEDDIDKEIDYAIVNALLDSERKQTMDFLNGAID